MLTAHDLIMREAVCVWAVFRKMGYPAEEIFIQGSPADDKGINVLMSLKHAGRECAFRIGYAGYSFEEMQRRWNAIALEWNTATDDERTTVFDQSVVMSQATKIVAAMISHGFGTTPDQIPIYDEKARKDQ